MNLAGVVVIILIVAVGLIGLAAIAGVILLSLRSGRVTFEELPTTARRTAPASDEPTAPLASLPGASSPLTADEPTHVRLDPTPLKEN